MIPQRWPLPAPGDVVWCMFPHLPELEPGPKPRPAIVMSVEEKSDGAIIGVVYGTSQRVHQLKSAEVAITQAKQAAAYAQAGLAYDTKFDFKRIIELPWSERYFKAAPQKPCGNSPKLGTLHATVLHAVEAAYRAAAST
jgi:PemK-like, MazF-like toxin of type II toxin-antitoxin system